MSYILDEIKRKHMRKKYQKELDKYRRVDLYHYQFYIVTTNNEKYNMGNYYKYTDLTFSEFTNELLEDKSVKTNTEEFISSKHIVNFKLISIDELKDFYHYTYGDSRDSFINFFSGKDINEQIHNYEEVKKLYDEVK